MTETILEVPQSERTCAYRILRYTPNLVRDEWVNIGVLVFDPRTGEHRLRMIEEPEEYTRVRRLHPKADESLLRAVRDDLEDRFEVARRAQMQENGGGESSGVAFERLLTKWENTLSNALQLASPKGVISNDLDVEVDRLFTDRVAVPRPAPRAGVPGTRAQMRSYCLQVFRQARVWDRIQKSIRVSEFTFRGDPMRIDYSYRRNGTRGFVQTLSVLRAPNDVRGLAHTAEDIAAKAALKTEFAAITDVELTGQNDRYRFVDRTLRDAGIVPVPLDHFAVWVGKLKPHLQ